MASPIFFQEIECGPNEGCINAALGLEIPLLASGSTSVEGSALGDNIALTAGGNCSNLTTPETIGIWFQGQTEYSGCVRLSTSGSLFDTVLAVYSGPCDKLTCLAANDDSSSLVRTSEIVLTIEPHVQYKVFVGGVGNTTGDYTVSLDLVAIFEPCK